MSMHKAVILHSDGANIYEGSAGQLVGDRFNAKLREEEGPLPEGASSWEFESVERISYRESSGTAVNLYLMIFKHA